MEIDVETAESYRNRGFATAAGIEFIDLCLNRSLIPNYSCWEHNIGSVALAKKLGFVESSDETVYGIKKPV